MPGKSYRACDNTDLLPMSKSNNRTHLSKSSFLKGLQCIKNLYLYYHSPEIAKEFDDNERLLFKRSQVLEELARNLFPGGLLIKSDPETSIETKLRSTEKALEKKEQDILYQPAFEYDRNFAKSTSWDK